MMRRNSSAPDVGRPFEAYAASSQPFACSCGACLPKQKICPAPSHPTYRVNSCSSTFQSNLGTANVKLNVAKVPAVSVAHTYAAMNTSQASSTHRHLRLGLQAVPAMGGVRGPCRSTATFLEAHNKQAFFSFSMDRIQVDVISMATGWSSRGPSCQLTGASGRCLATRMTMCSL